MTTSEEHNSKVRELADRMPSKRLRLAVLAIGRRADFHTGVTSGYAVRTISSQSKKFARGKFYISERTLKRAIPQLQQMGVMEIERTSEYRKELGQRVRGPNVYRLNYCWHDSAQRAESLPPNQPVRVTAVDKEWMDSLGSYPEPP